MSTDWAITIPKKPYWYLPQAIYGRNFQPQNLPAEKLTQYVLHTIWTSNLIQANPFQRPVCFREPPPWWICLSFRPLVRHRQALSRWLLEWPREQCLWLYQAAFPTEEEKSQAQGSSVYWWLDLLTHLCSGFWYRCRTAEICWFCYWAGEEFGSWWYWCWLWGKFVELGLQIRY